MIKVIMLMKKRPGMTTSEFRDYYENNHRVIGEKYLNGFAVKYIRRFINPLVDRSGNLTDPEYDVLMEVWYPDEETFKACGEKLSEPDIAKEIREDEEKIFEKNVQNITDKHISVVDEKVSTKEKEIMTIWTH